MSWWPKAAAVGEPRPSRTSLIPSRDCVGPLALGSALMPLCVALLPTLLRATARRARVASAGDGRNAVAPVAGSSSRWRTLLLTLRVALAPCLALPARRDSAHLRPSVAGASSDLGIAVAPRTRGASTGSPSAPRR
eukprot:5540103-Alexandrium_andersonii.AAC.1